MAEAIEKASGAYGISIKRDLEKAIQRLKEHPDRLSECMEALKIASVPQALLWKRIRALKPKSTPKSKPGSKRPA